MAGTDWSPKSVTPTDWGGGTTKPTDFAGVSGNPKDWLRNKLDYLAALVTTIYDDPAVTYDDIAVFYDGYDPSTVTPLDLNPADYAPVPSTGTDWNKT